VHPLNGVRTQKQKQRQPEINSMTLPVLPSFFLAGFAGGALLLYMVGFNLDIGGAVLFHVKLISRNAR
jgi:hypothetical protein